MVENVTQQVVTQEGVTQCEMSHILSKYKNEVSLIFVGPVNGKEHVTIT